jgi:hypothetical protein
MNDASVKENVTSDQAKRTGVLYQSLNVRQQQRMSSTLLMILECLEGEELAV